MRRQQTTNPVNLHDALERASLGACENCEAKTPFLFEGFKFQNVRAEVVRDMTNATLVRMKAFAEPFSTQRAEVCFRCRPLSNLEREELCH